MVAGLFVFIGTYGGFIFKPPREVQILSAGDAASYCLNLFFISAIIWLGVTFLTRYSGYQNAKIAELGYFITSAPALHLQEYGHQELRASALEIAGEEVKLSKEFDPVKRQRLMETLGHWDRWARKLEEDVRLKPLKDEFSQDRILSWLLQGVSYAPAALSAIFFAKFLPAILDLSAASPVSSMAGLGALFFASTLIAAGCPISTGRAFLRGNRIKDAYRERRDDVPLY